MTMCLIQMQAQTCRGYFRNISGAGVFMHIVFVARLMVYLPIGVSGF